jgi:hypothetical protein
LEKKFGYDVIDDKNYNECVVEKDKNALDLITQAAGSGANLMILAKI